MRRRTRSRCSVVFLGAVAALSGPAAAESLSVSFTTSSSGCTVYAPTNCVAVWLEDGNGRFVRTLGRWGETYWYDLRDWQAASRYDTDAVMGATRLDHAATATADANGDIGSLPDGAYKVQLELTDWEMPFPGYNNRATFELAKDGAAAVLTPPAQGGFYNVTIDYSGRTPGPNYAPGVYAGPDQRTAKMAVILDGAATDDGLPSGSLTTTWSKFSGPGTVSFEDASALNTAASFTQEGVYVLQLEAYDGALPTTDQVAVVVHAVTLNPVADAHVQGGIYDSINCNWLWLIVQDLDGGGSMTAEGYLRFDVSGVSGTVISATLRLASMEYYLLGPKPRVVSAVSDDAWIETGITWSNKPTPGAQIVQYTPGHGWIEMDVRDYIVAEMAGDGHASLNVAGAADSAWSTFGSRDSYVPPELVVMTTSPQDTDGDGMPDQWETDNSLDPGSAADAFLDPDGDSLNNVREYVAGTDAQNPDTDGDGLLDGEDPDPLHAPGNGGICGAMAGGLAAAAALVLLALRRRPSTCSG